MDIINDVIYYPMGAKFLKKRAQWQQETKFAVSLS